MSFILVENSTWKHRIHPFFIQESTGRQRMMLRGMKTKSEKWNRRIRNDYNVLPFRICKYRERCKACGPQLPLPLFMNSEIVLVDSSRNSKCDLL